MIEFQTDYGTSLFVNPALVEAVESGATNPVGGPRARIKVASGKEYVVEGSAGEAAQKLFPTVVTARRAGAIP